MFTPRTSSRRAAAIRSSASIVGVGTRSRGCAGPMGPCRSIWPAGAVAPGCPSSVDIRSAAGAGVAGRWAGWRVELRCKRQTPARPTPALASMTACHASRRSSAGVRERLGQLRGPRPGSGGRWILIAMPSRRPWWAVVRASTTSQPRPIASRVRPWSSQQTARRSCGRLTTMNATPCIGPNEISVRRRPGCESGRRLPAFAPTRGCAPRRSRGEPDGVGRLRCAEPGDERDIRLTPRSQRDDQHRRGRRATSRWASPAGVIRGRHILLRPEIRIRPRDRRSGRRDPIAVTPASHPAGSRCCDPLRRTASCSSLSSDR